MALFIFECWGLDMWKNKIKKAKLAEPGSTSPEPSDVADVEGPVDDADTRPDISENTNESVENGIAKRQRNSPFEGSHETASMLSPVDDNVLDRAPKRARNGEQPIMTHSNTPSPENSSSRSARPSKRDQNWDIQYESLLAFANKYKHCNIRTGYSADGDDKPQVNLYAWLALQRRHKKQNKLRPDREQKLQALVDSGLLSWSGSDLGGQGYDEDEYIQVLPPPPPPSWENHFGEVLVFAEKYGHANVPLGYLVTIEKRKDIDLGFWLEEQRKLNAKNLLDNPVHVTRLDTLAKEGLLSLEVGSGAASTASVPGGSVQGGSREETRELTNAALVVHREDQATLDAKWTGRYQAMLNFIARPENRTVCAGDEILATLVASVQTSNGDHREETFDLGCWVQGQRRTYAAESLSEHRKGLLQPLVDAGQFAWLSQEEAARMAIAEEKRNKEEDALWTAWYNALVWHGVNKGHCNISSHGTITLPDGSEAELGKWLHIQRVYIKKGRLRVDRVRKIKKLYDEGKLDPAKWAHVFYMEYPVGTFGDIMVPSTMVTGGGVGEAVDATARTADGGQVHSSV